MNDQQRKNMQAIADADQENARLRDELVAMLSRAVEAADHVIGVCEADVRAGHDPSPFVKSCPSASLAECYAAMAFVGDARGLLNRIE